MLIFLQTRAPTRPAQARMHACAQVVLWMMMAAITRVSPTGPVVASIDTPRPYYHTSSAYPLLPCHVHNMWLCCCRSTSRLVSCAAAQQAALAWCSRQQQRRGMARAVLRPTGATCASRCGWQRQVQAMPPMCAETSMACAQTRSSACSTSYMAGGAVCSANASKAATGRRAPL